MTDFSNQQGVCLQVRGLRKSYDGHEVLKGVKLPPPLNWWVSKERKLKCPANSRAA